LKKQLLRVLMLTINGKQNSMKWRVKDTLIFKSQSTLVNQNLEAMKRRNSLRNKSQSPLNENSDVNARERKELEPRTQL